MFGKDGKDTEVQVSAITAKRNANKAVVKEWLGLNPELTPEVLEAVKYLAGLGTRSRMSAVNSALKDMLMKAPMSAIDVFTNFEYGRPTMEKKIKEFIKVSDPSRRIWVAFEDGNYIVKGAGAEAPDGWAGYLPVVETEL